MSNALIGVGTLLAIFGPLLFVPMIWLVYRFVTLRVVTSWGELEDQVLGVTGVALALSTLLVFAVVAVSYAPGRIAYHRMCALHGTPVISERTHVDGFYRTHMFLPDAGFYLGDGGFAYLEAPSPYYESLLRYTLGENGVVDEEENQLSTKPLWCPPRLQ